MSKEAKKVWNHNFNYDPCITLSVHTHSSFLIETFVETFERFVLIMLYVVLHKVISFCFVLSQVFVIFYIWFHWLFFWFIFFFFIINASYAKIRFFSHYSPCLQSNMRRRSFSQVHVKNLMGLFSLLFTVILLEPLQYEKRKT